MKIYKELHPENYLIKNKTKNSKTECRVSEKYLNNNLVNNYEYLEHLFFMGRKSVFIYELTL